MKTSNQRRHLNTIAFGVLLTLTGASFVNAGSHDARDRYAEKLYGDFSVASSNIALFDVRTVASGRMSDLKGKSFADLTGIPTHRLAFNEMRDSRINAAVFTAADDQINIDELSRSVADFDAVGLPVAQGRYRLLAVLATIDGKTLEHRALEFCWSGKSHCVVYDPQIEFLDSVVNNYRTAIEQGYGVRIQEQQPTTTGDITTQAVCRLASNHNIVGRSATWAARTVTYKNVLGTILVKKTLGGQQVGISCNSYCRPAMYGYSYASSAYGNLGYNTDCGNRHATGTTGGKGTAHSQTKCTHVLVGSARADVSVEGSGAGIDLSWILNGGIDSSGGSLTDTCAYF